MTRSIEMPKAIDKVVTGAVINMVSTVSAVCAFGMKIRKETST